MSSARAASYRAAIKELARPGAGKFKTGKLLLKVSEDRPSLLYPHFSALHELLQSDNKIIRWTAIRIIANLAAVDRRHRIAGILDEYLTAIAGPVMVTAANTIQGAARIANAQPRLAPKVVTAILQVENAQYQTEECRNVAIGHAITAFGTMGERARRRREVKAFVVRQLGNSRTRTRLKAEAFLKETTRKPDR